MGRKALNLEGREYKNFYVQQKAGYTKNESVVWVCLCKCGKIFDAPSSYIVKHENLSCGCQNRRKVTNFIIGEKYGNFTVSGERKKAGKYYNIPVTCVCGKSLDVLNTSLTSGRSTSCGCIGRQTKSTHKQSSTKMYKAYHGMLTRCYNSKHINFHQYGGRGITVCDRWLESFENFYADMGERPKGLTLERVDVNKNYSPENCVWASSSEQAFNRRKMKNNTSGRQGVFWNKRKNRWVVSLIKDGKGYWGGQFISLEDAIEAVIDLENKLWGVSRVE